jgi:hypothetical protein
MILKKMAMTESGANCENRDVNRAGIEGKKEVLQNGNGTE